MEAGGVSRGRVKRVVTRELDDVLTANRHREANFTRQHWPNQIRHIICPNMRRVLPSRQENKPCH